MKNNAKTVIIGLDGVPFDMVEDFCNSGVMPNTAELISEGIFKKMLSSVPDISSVAWSSAITGKNPAEHGIFGFTDLFPGTYKTRFPNFNDLKVRPFWEEWDGESVIINVPSTFPVKDMKGVHISGFVSIDMERSVYPKSMISKLNEMDYRLDVDTQKAHVSPELFLSDLEKTLQARIESYRYFWDSINWQQFMLVFTGTDRMMHFLWDAYEDPGHKYHEYFIDHFRVIDNVIGEIMKKISHDDLLIIHSDHGFEKLEQDVYVNYVLMENGLLKIREGTVAKLNNIDNDTKAFALDPGRIYLNIKGKYPNGSVEPHETENLIEKIRTLFADLEIEGRKVISMICQKEEIYSGSYLDIAPDLVLIAAKGFNLRANLKTSTISSKSIFSGKHSYDNAFMIANQVIEKDTIPEMPCVSDIRMILEKNRSESIYSRSDVLT